MSRSTVDKTKNDEIIYYNGTVTNNQNQNTIIIPAPAIFTDQRLNAILNKADDYYMSVVRWSIPMSTIPLIILEPLVNTAIPPFMTPNTDPNNIGFAVGLNWWTGTTYVDYNTFIYYSPQNNIPAPTLPKSPINESYWYVYTYQHLINMINEAFADCFRRIKIDFGAITATEPPVILYDSATNLYTLHCQSVYASPAINAADPTNPDPNIRFASRTALTIYMNLNLWDSIFIPFINFDFLGVNNLSPPDPNNSTVYSKAVRLIVEDNGNNVILDPSGNPEYIDMVGEIPVLSNASSFQNIILISRSLPIQYESINPAIIGNVQSSSNNTIQIVSDYTYDTFASNQTISARLGIVYTPSVYRFTNLISSNPLNYIDIEARFLDNINVDHPIFLRSNSTFNFKLMFVKKSKMPELIRGGMKIEYM